MITTSHGGQDLPILTPRSVNFLDSTKPVDTDQIPMILMENGLSTASNSSYVTVDAMIDEAIQTSVFQIVSYIKDRLRYRRLMKHREKVVSVLKELHSLSVTIHGRMSLAELANDDDSDLDPEIRRLFYVLVQTAPVQEWSNRN